MKKIKLGKEQAIQRIRHFCAYQERAQHEPRDRLYELGMTKSEVEEILSDLIKAHVENAFDHKNLNLDVPDFTDLNPTAENIAVVIWQKLRPFINADKDLEVVLYETPRNFVTYKGE